MPLLTPNGSIIQNDEEGLLRAGSGRLPAGTRSITPVAPAESNASPCLGRPGLRTPGPLLSQEGSSLPPGPEVPLLDTGILMFTAKGGDNA